MKQTLAAERSTPRRRPGKKPTSMAVTGNLLQDVAGELVSHATGVTEVAALLDVGVDMDAAEDAVGATSWLLLTEQSPAELQEYPNGQHKLPQVGSVAESAVVMSEISGFAVTFCEERSQGIALIVEQELPDGQQSTVVLAASTMQSDEGAQQKSDGSPAWLHCVYVGSPQDEVRWKILSEVCAAVEVARQAVVSQRWLVRIRLIVPPRTIIIESVVSPVGLVGSWKMKRCFFGISLSREVREAEKSRDKEQYQIPRLERRRTKQLWIRRSSRPQQWLYIRRRI
jgi:hypothetical protein